MLPSIRIDTSHTDLTDLMRQVGALKEFPCMVEMLDRVFQIANRDELIMLMHGLEIGSYFTEGNNSK